MAEKKKKQAPAPATKGGLRNRKVPRGGGAKKGGFTRPMKILRRDSALRAVKTKKRSFSPRNIRVPYFEMQEMMDFFASIGKKYEFRRSGNTQKLLVNGCCYFSSTLSEARKNKEAMPDNQVYFVSKVKRYIEKNRLTAKIKPNYKSKDDIRYFDYNQTVGEGESINDVYSVDIVKAYWVAALKEGWISEDIFEEGLDVHKIARLSSLGSFAKSIDVYRFNGKDEEFVRCIEPKMPHVFFNQANTVFKIMDACRKALLEHEKGFLFYWTDGLYVRGSVCAKICEAVIDSFGFESKTTRLKRIVRTKSAFISIERDENDRTKEKCKEYPIAIGTGVKPLKIENNTGFIGQAQSKKGSGAKTKRTGRWVTGKGNWGWK